MAKTIKFNLICDGNPVRNLEDLQNNFAIEDILAYYDKKLLHRWLKVRGYEKELEAVTKITAQAPIDIIQELIAIFDIPADLNQVREEIYILKYLDERQELYHTYEQNSTKVKNILNDHQTGYLQQVTLILDNKDDIVRIRSALSDILKHYYDLFVINHRDLFYKLYYNAPLSIFVLLTFPEARRFYLPEKVQTGKPKNDANSPEGVSLNAICAFITGTVQETANRGKAGQADANKDLQDDIDGQYEKETAVYMADKAEMYEKICTLTKLLTKETLGDNLITFSGYTDGYWKDLEPKGKKYMILSMEYGSYIRSAGQTGVELGAGDVKNRFIILNGIDYKSNNNYDKLLYMEV